MEQEDFATLKQEFATMKEKKIPFMGRPVRLRSLKTFAYWLVVIQVVAMMGLVAWGIHALAVIATENRMPYLQAYWAPLLEQMAASSSMAAMATATPTTVVTIPTATSTLTLTFTPFPSTLATTLATKTFELTTLQKEFSTKLTAHNEFLDFKLGYMRMFLTDILMLSLGLETDYPFENTPVHTEGEGLTAPIIYKLLEIAKGENKHENAEKALSYLREVVSGKEIDLVKIAGLVKDFTVAIMAMDGELLVWVAYVEETVAAVARLMDEVEKLSFMVMNEVAGETVGEVVNSTPAELEQDLYMQKVLHVTGEKGEGSESALRTPLSWFVQMLPVVFKSPSPRSSIAAFTSKDRQTTYDNQQASHQAFS
ncbi:hypothetical protein VTL71DRAFT_1398 [Oculimacula yallundae]|uniref:Uncharacterized protein n=1 Tax=Oculimacula yallundae TaxID=86028 RepID=A0ABR4CAR0_9HELO